MKIVMQITDEIIRSNVEDALKECEEEQWVSVPADFRSEFIEECVSEIIRNYENADYYEDRLYNPDYEEIVLDMAHWYDYEIDQ